MNPSQHYKSYGTSIQEDALEGYIDFSKHNSPRGEPSGTYYTLLKKASEEIHRSIDAVDIEGYKRNLREHQSTLFSMFKDMALKKLKPYSQQDVEIIGAGIANHGWPWFKFLDVSIVITMAYEDWHTAVHIIPRYCDKFEHVWNGKAGPYLDSDEFLMLKKMASKSFAKEFLQAKDGKRGLKLLPKSIWGDTKTRRFWEYNKPFILDWTLELFPEEE